MNFLIQELWMVLGVIVVLLFFVVIFMAFWGSKVMSYDTQGYVISAITAIVKVIVIPLTLSIFTLIIKNKPDTSYDCAFGIIVLWAILLGWLECWPIYRKYKESKGSKK